MSNLRNIFSGVKKQSSLLDLLSTVKPKPKVAPPEVKRPQIPGITIPEVGEIAPAPGVLKRMPEPRIVPDIPDVEPIEPVKPTELTKPAIGSALLGDLEPFRKQVEKPKLGEPRFDLKKAAETFPGVGEFKPPEETPFTAGFTAGIPALGEFVRGQIPETFEKAEELSPGRFRAGEITGRAASLLAAYAAAAPVAAKVGIEKAITGAVAKTPLASSKLVGAVLKTPLAKKIGVKTGEQVAEFIGKFGATQGAALLLDTIAQSPFEVYDFVKNDKDASEDVKQFVKNRAVDSAFNLAFGVGGSLLQLRKMLKSGDSAIVQAVQEGAQTLPSAQRQTIQQELGLAPDVTAQDFLKQQERLAGDIETESFFKQFDRTPSQVIDDFNRWRSQNFGGAFGQVSAGDEQALKELYKETTGIDIDVAFREAQEATIPKALKDITPEPARIAAEDIGIPRPEPTIRPVPEARAVVEPTAEVGLKNRQFIENTMLNADVVPAEMKNQIAQNIPQYQPISNVETFGNAQSKVARNAAQALDEFTGLKSIRNADDTALGEALIVDAINKGDFAKSIDVSTQLAEQLTELGQAVQAASIMKRLSPQGMLQYASKQINKSLAGVDPSTLKRADNVIDQVDNVLKDATKVDKIPEIERIFKEFGLTFPEGGVTPENLQAVVKDQLKIPNLSTVDAEFIVNNMRRLEGLPDGREKDIALNEVMQYIANKIPSSGAEKVKAFLRMSMLLNPKTLITRNPLGNTIFGALENVSQIPSGAVDIATSKLLQTPRQTAVVPNLKSQMQGFAKGVTDMFDDIRLGVDTAVTRGGVELPRSKTVFDNKPLDTLHNFMGTLLQLGDRPFFQAAYRQRMDELVKLRGVAEPTPEMIADATQFASSRVFQDKTAISEFGQSLKKAMNKLNVKGIGAGDIVLPFVQTPANIFGKSIEYTPLGLVKALKEAPTASKVAKGTFDQKAFTDAIGRTMTGSAIALAGYKLAEAGLMKGKPQGTRAESALDRAVGQSSYAIKFGDTWNTFDWAQPASTPLAVGVDFFEAGRSEKDFKTQIEKGLISGGDTLFRQSFLQGVQRLMGGYSPTKGIVSTVAQAPLQAFPTFGSQVAKQLDPSRRVVTGETPFETAANVAKLKTPGLRQTLEPQIDIFGQDILESQGRKGVEKAIEVFLSPGFKSVETQDPTILEIKRLHTETGDSDIIPKVAKDFTNEGVKIELTPQEITSMQRSMGQETKTKLDRLFASESYQNAPEEAKTNMISGIINLEYKKAKLRILRGRGQQ